MQATLCFAVPGSASIIDVCNPETGGSQVRGMTLEELRRETPGVELVSLDEHCAAKAARQDAEKHWKDTTEGRYFEMLEVLPPAAMAGGAFLVGEPQDHHAGTGRPRFACFKREGGKHFELSVPITVAEFRQLFAGGSR